ncbi:hypothetical protein [Dactylosporangium sp. CS-033363]|uniref:hypothetical protein n=1 Tax=Dactylosporangium sp. CS-033363 TaxID=3239935 RepID=UPI003D8F4BA5
MTNARTLVVIVLVAALSGCGTSSTPAPAPAAATSGQAAPAASAAPSPAPVKVDAKAAAEALAAAGLPVTNVAAQDENTDPNNLLGRPGSYVSRASFDVAGGDKDAELYGIDRGGVIEVFADAGTAQARSKYIQDTLKSLQMLGTEYHYLNGPVLVRVTGKVKPSVAKPFEAAVAALKVG